ncbi:MORN repeat-containing protein [Constantimarinum furrinae]|uniref:MORN repeat protein n=1 Tax=Constantimarinum furrinae TaxID=2562285 RepID=A0A7G8PRM1_9FLAO|nr:hypothetical protein [Constantimarinum furrinae]QNJ96987.1 hypothetical protein ALE3EI_0400 [Constantimarinum furrinae]
MRSTLALTTLLFYISFLSWAQVPTPMTTNSSSGVSGPSWTKTGSSSYTLKDGNGNTMSNTMKLYTLKTDTISYLDKNSRTIYLLPDAESASDGSSGKLTVLAQNISKNFYITNPYSFVTMLNDESVIGKFVNINGSYVYYLDETDKTYYHEGIRKINGWGAKNVTQLPAAPNHTYWYRDVESSSYGVIIRGETLDYSTATTEADGNDLIVKINGVKTYRLPGYYTMASFIIKPVELISSGGSTTTTAGTTGCVRGDCNNGWGKWQYEDAYYDGFWKNGKKEGYGLYKWDGIGKYIGNWENDTMKGYGAYIADNDDNIIGEYRDGELNGLGYTVFGDTWSQGIYENGNLSTPFDYFRNSGDTGCTSGDCQNKYGYFKYSNGDHFVGFFKNGEKYLGTYTFADGNKYSGMFNSSGQYHGTGRFFFADGSYYGGEWKNGKQHGKGYFHDKDINQKIGIWENGVLITPMK